MAKQKSYVVWEGVTPGVHTSWTGCQFQIKGYEAAKYELFSACGEVEHVLTMSPCAYIGKNVKAKSRSPKPFSDTLSSYAIGNSLAIDAAHGGNPESMKYRGVHIANHQETFHFGLMKGTNSIGKLSAIVHSLVLSKKRSSDVPIYSDSVNATSWVRQKKYEAKLPRTLETEEFFLLTERAEEWLQGNTYTTRVLRWEAKERGGTPADLGRK